MLGLLFLLPSVSAFLPNDVCSGAVPISDGTNLRTNIGAVVEAGHTTCIRYSDVFFSYRATCTGKMSVELDFREAVEWRMTGFEGRDCGNLGAEVGCGCCESTWSVVKDQVYYVAVGFKVDIDQIDFHVNVSCSSTVVAGDFCENAIEVMDGPNEVDNTNTGRIAQTPCLQYHDVFVRYNATCTGRATATYTDNQAAVMAYFQGPGCGMLGVARNCAEKQIFGTLAIDFPVVQNQFAYFGIGVIQTVIPGVLPFEITCTPIPRPPNDRCQGAVSLFDNQQISTNTKNSQTQVFECGSNLPSSVFFKYQATCTGDAVVRTKSLTLVNIAVFSGNTCENLGRGIMPCQLSSFPFAVVSGLSYYLALGIFGGGYYGQINVTINCTTIVRPAYDSCANALEITEGRWSVSNEGATRDVSSIGTPIYQDLFFKYQPFCNGTATIAYFKADVQLNAALFVGNCDLLQRLFWVESTDSQDISFDVVRGQQFYLSIGDTFFGASPGLINVTVTCVGVTPPPSPSAPTSQPTMPTSFPTTLSEAPTTQTTTAPTPQDSAPTLTTAAPSSDPGSPTPEPMTPTPDGLTPTPKTTEAPTLFTNTAAPTLSERVEAGANSGSPTATIVAVVIAVVVVLLAIVGLWFWRRAKSAKLNEYVALSNHGDYQPPAL